MCRTGWPWSIGRRRAKGRDFELAPILQPLAPYRDQMLVLSGIKASWNYIHAGASGSFLTGTSAADATKWKSSPTSRWISCWRDTSPRTRRWDRSSSRWIAPTNAGACTGNLSCVYTHTLSWRSPTQPLPTEWNPRAVFEKLFGDSGSTERAAREARMHAAQEHPGFRHREAGELKKELGPQRSGQSRRISRQRFAMSSAAFRGPRNRGTWNCRPWSSRWARRRCSKIIWR